MILQSARNRAMRALFAAFALIAALSAMAEASSEKVLYAFHGQDGRAPSSVVLGPDGTLYGTAWWGGTNSCLGQGCGVVFRLARGEDGKWHETVLHDFAGSDGWFPNGSLVADKAGNLYGTTVYGGPNGCSGLGCGVAFELERGTGGKWTYTILHYFFQQQGDGLQPYAGMIFDMLGNLYGTTSGGGNLSACADEGGCGVVFELSPYGKGTWTETIVYAFDGKDGVGPMAPVIFDSSGDLCGTTQYGGANKSGTVFRLASGENGQWSEEVLHSFNNFGTRDGYEPIYGVTFDTLGDLFGATPFGGTVGEQGWGTAFKLAPAGGGKWKETILRTFDRARVGGGYVSSGLLLIIRAICTVLRLRAGNTSVLAAEQSVAGWPLG